jgi:hypothetical protein
MYSATLSLCCMWYLCCALCSVHSTTTSCDLCCSYMCRHTPGHCYEFVQSKELMYVHMHSAICLHCFVLPQALSLQQQQGQHNNNTAAAASAHATSSSANMHSNNMFSSSTSSGGLLSGSAGIDLGRLSDDWSTVSLTCSIS